MDQTGSRSRRIEGLELYRRRRHNALNAKRRLGVIGALHIPIEAELGAPGDNVAERALHIFGLEERRRATGVKQPLNGAIGEQRAVTCVAASSSAEDSAPRLRLERQSRNW